MSTSPQPQAEAAADEQIWRLNARTRLLVQRIQREIIDPARKRIGETGQRLEQARAAHKAAIAECNSQVAQPRLQAERLFQVAREHLIAQGADTSGVPLLLDNSIRYTTVDTQSLDEAHLSNANLKRLVEENVIRSTKPKEFWRPDSDGGGCALIIGAVFVGIIGANIGGFIGFILGLCLVYFPILWWLHSQPLSDLRSTFPHVHENAQRVLAFLNEYSAGMTAMADATLNEAEKAFSTEIAAFDQTLREPVRLFHAEIVSLWADTGFAGADWGGGDWVDWRPASSPAFAARFGELAAETADLPQYLTSDLRFTVPALTPFPDGRSLLFKAAGAQKDRAANAIQSVLARLLATIPPAKLRFTFVDPIALGSNVAAFMTLSDHEESLVTGRAWSEPQHIEQRLGDLTEHMETVIQKYLRTDFKTIYDYNEAAKEVAEPYRFLVVFDFPVNFTDTSARRLISIARNGARCGVYALIVCDTTKPLPYGFSLDELQQSTSVVAMLDAPQQPRSQTVKIATAELGKTYPGTVMRLVDFGAFIEVFPGVLGLLHISEIAETRVKEVSDELKEGDRILVKVIEVVGDKLKLSRKAVLREQREQASSAQTNKAAVHSAAASPLNRQSLREQLHDGFRWDDPVCGSWLLRLDSPAPREILSRMISTVGALANDAMRVEVPYRKLLNLAQLSDESWWKATTTKSIRVPLGPTGARKLQYLVLGEGVGHHALIVGRPGSGKSNLMHVIITTLALSYSPDEIRLYLIDFKKGVEFKGYADCKLPHAEAIAIESEREFGLSVVERLDVELKRRGDIFRAAGASNIAEYRGKTDKQIPRVLLLVDEFQEFFTQDDNIARQTTLILDRLVRQGRAFGIHIILAACG